VPSSEARPQSSTRDNPAGSAICVAP
jgi:hypothetical protein